MYFPIFDRLLSWFNNLSIGQKEESVSEALSITDRRTRRKFHIPVKRNAIRAIDLKAISTPGAGFDPVDQVENGLRILDPGYQNTAFQESQITYVQVPFYIHLPKTFNRQALMLTCPYV